MVFSSDRIEEAGRGDIGESVAGGVSDDRVQQLKSAYAYDRDIRCANRGIEQVVEQYTEVRRAGGRGRTASSRTGREPNVRQIDNHDIFRPGGMEARNGLHSIIYRPWNHDKRIFAA